MSAPIWLDAIIPLAEGVPVLGNYEDSEVFDIPGVVVEVEVETDSLIPFPIRVHHLDHPDEKRAVMYYDLCDVRVDMSTDIGFGYALRWLLQTHQGNLDEEWAAGCALAAITWRHMYGTTTDADRLTLAHAIAKVQS